MERATQKDERGYYLICDGIYSDWGAPEKFRGDHVDRLAAYEDTGLEPCDYSAIGHALELAGQAKSDLIDVIRIIGVIGLDRLRELAQADKEGRIRILSAGKGKSCGTCANFQPVPGHKCGDCKARKYFRASQSCRACSMYIGKDGSYAD